MLRTKHIRPIHASQVRSADSLERMNDRLTMSEGPTEAKAARQLTTVRKEVALASQEGDIGLASHILYVSHSSRTRSDDLRLT